VVDIETAPILANVWRIWQENVGVEQIRKDTHLLSFAAKWLGETEIIYRDQSKVKAIENDKSLLLALWRLLDEADIVVVHNGRAFDIPTIKARMAINGINPPSPYRTVDTCIEARKHFNFTSNKLEYLAKTLGCKIVKDHHAEYPGFELWKECVKGNQRAWRVMKRYNIGDINALEEVYLKLRSWLDGHPNVGMYADDTNGDEPVCPKCAGRVQRRGMRATQFGTYQNYVCNDCGGWSRGRKHIKVKRTREQLSN